MQIVIDIPEEMQKALEQGSFGAKYNIYDFVGCVMNGTPLPKGHGRLIDADALLISEEECNRISDCLVCKMNIQTCEHFESAIKAAPTIIEAEKEDKECI